MVSLTLNRMHYNRRIARPLIYIPRHLGGLEFGSLTTIQGAGKILLLRHLRTPGQPHDLLTVALDRFQYMAGVSFDIMEKPQQIIPYLEGIWLPTARDYLALINGSMKITGLKIQQIERHGDQHIMDAALSSNVLQRHELKYINYCRLYLQMLTISDMRNAEGNKLADGVRSGRRTNTQSYSILEEPNQVRPNNQVWGIWRRFLQSICNTKDKLLKPLGPWFNRMSTQRRWHNYYCLTKNVLHRQSDTGKYTTHRRLRFRVFSLTPSADPTDESTDIPIPIDVNTITDGLLTSRYQQEAYTSRTEPANKPSFQEYLLQQPEHKSSLFSHFDFLAGSTHEVCSCITSLRNTLLVTDGGATQDYGSFGWVLGLSNGTRLAQGSGVVFGHDPKSYRAEAYGAKAGSLLLMHLFRYCDHKLQDDNDGFTYYCDNEGLIMKLQVFCKY
jgi:hypothetical protein